VLNQQKNAISALVLKRHFGVSCPAAWGVKRKLLQVMLERNADRQLPSGRMPTRGDWPPSCSN
jgi:hypothetical protein